MTALAKIVYNLALLALFPLLLPGFLLRMCRRGGYLAHFSQRFALYGRDFPEGGRFVWVHAVSVGEVQVAGQLMREWRKADPSVKFCFSTTSSTGHAMAEREIAAGDALIYNPIDFPTFVKAALKRIRPQAIVLVESELWPNFVWQAKKQGIPLYLVNARISDRSAPRYRAARFLFKSVLGSFERIFAQSALDRERLLAAGAPAGAVETAGSFKFDVARRNPGKEEELRAWMSSRGLAAGSPLVVGGSTWPGEDEVLLGIYKRLLAEARARGDAALPALAIAPRHFEKADNVEANILKAGFKCARRSTGATSGEGGQTVFLADTTGELMGLYGIAAAVFVGKSLCEHGSQNMIEPCLCGKPVAVGPFTENFRPVMCDLLAARAIVQVADAKALGDVISAWLREGDGGLGERARAAVENRRGVVARCVRAISRPLARRSGAEERGARGGIAGAAVFSILLLAAAGLAAWHFVSPPQDAPRRVFTPPKSLPKLKAVKTATAFIAMMEKPDAARVLLAGDQAAQYRYAFDIAGLKIYEAGADEPEHVRYDIVFVAGATGGRTLADLAAKTTERGIVAAALDVHDMKFGALQKILEAFPAPDWHLWMPGARDWLVTGRPVPRKDKMGALLEFFARPGLLTPETEEAGCCSLSELFASYAGSKKDLARAFTLNKPSTRIEPQYFILDETPDIDWISPDEMDGDVVANLASAIRILQENRRSIIKAGMLSQSPEKENEAVAAWAEAMKLNPRDTMLLDRLYLLAVNARAFTEVGNIAYAAKCYETMIAIRPGDATVLEKYAACLDRLGKRGLAAAVREKARTLR